MSKSDWVNSVIIGVTIVLVAEFLKMRIFGNRV